MLLSSVTQRKEKVPGKLDPSGNSRYAPLSDAVNAVLQRAHEVHSPSTGNLL